MIIQLKDRLLQEYLDHPDFIGIGISSKDNEEHIQIHFNIQGEKVNIPSELEGIKIEVEYIQPPKFWTKL